MKDFDRFTGFLLREAAGYNEPPDTPADAMWTVIEARLGAAEAGLEQETSVVVSSVDERAFDGLAYNDPPAVPREEMWARIEAAWALRRSAAPMGLEAPAAADAAPITRFRPAWLGKRRATGWVAALAAAASLVLGIALGRGTRTPQPGETLSSPATAQDPIAAPTTVVERESVQSNDMPEPQVRVAGITGSVTVLSTDAPVGGEVATPGLLAVSTLPERPSALYEPFEPENDYVTARHLGRAATLLTAFRTDRRTPASQEDLARWARELLAETRMFLGLPDSDSAMERPLLEDLELVLIQIAGLGPGAPDFEWDLARESMERRGTLLRLRAASAESET